MRHCWFTSAPDTGSYHVPNLFLACSCFAKRSAYNGLWQGRIIQERNGSSRIHVRDQGQTFRPIPLEVCDGTLHMLIHTWEEQMAEHALQVPCKLLVFQLLRFAQQSETVLKDQTPVRLHAGEVVRPPVFSGGDAADLSFISGFGCCLPRCE